MVLHFFVNQISSVSAASLTCFGQSCCDDGRLLFCGAVVSQHFVAEGSVIVFVVKLEWNDHPFLTVLAFKLLTHHEAHVGINSDAVAGNADSERHRFTTVFTLLQRGLCGVRRGQYDGRRLRQRPG